MQLRVKDAAAEGCLVPAVYESAVGTFETCRLHRAMSAFESNPEDTCSHWVLLSLTRNRPQTYKVPAGPARFHSDLDYQLAAAIVYQFWLVGAGGNGGWGRAKPIVPGGASMLALRVSTSCNVVRNAAITAITKAVAKIANTVRWVFIIDPPASTDLAVGWPRFLPREGNFSRPHHRLQSRCDPSGYPSRRSNSCLLTA